MSTRVHPQHPGNREQLIHPAQTVTRLLAAKYSTLIGTRHAR
jgi:hypothetical protein